MTLPSDLLDFVSGEPPSAFYSDGIQWLRGRPESLRPLMVRLPPSCVVRAAAGFGLPFRDGLAIVTSYFEDDHVSLRQFPDTAIVERIRCCADRLVAVAYWRGLTPQRMAELLR